MILILILILMQTLELMGGKGRSIDHALLPPIVSNTAAAVPAGGDSLLPDPRSLRADSGRRDDAVGRSEQEAGSLVCGADRRSPSCDEDESLGAVRGP